MVATTALADYAIKPRLYFEQARPEMLRFIPPSCTNALDVGCSNGSFGALLQEERKIPVWGVEPFASAAAEAATKLHRVVHGSFDASLVLPEVKFDCVIFNDVLEHLLDPAEALQRARSLLSTDGVIVASIPNIRHFPTLWHLAMHGEWEYRDCGTLDKTHLRFFTRKSIVDLFKQEGFRVDSIEGIHPFRGVPNASRRVWKLFRFVNAMCGSRFRDMTFERFAVLARPDGR